MAKNKVYEGMFLVDSAEAGADWDGIVAAVRRILERAEAEIISIRKWDDRRLAYEIRGKARGTYILCYFRADGDEIQAIEKAVQLSEKIMRVLILNVEHLTAEDMEKDTPASKVEKEKEKRQVADETAQEAKAAQPSTQLQEQTPEQTAAETAEEPAEETEQDEKTKQAPGQEAEDVQESKPNALADD